MMNAGRKMCKAAIFTGAVLATGLPIELRAQRNPAPAVEIDADDIGGVVTSRFGPEAGVWVIARTTKLGTRFAKIAVTDERGRYAVPDLPKAHYQFGYAAMVSSTPRKSTRNRASTST